MGFFTKNKGSKKRIIEEWVYELVADELDKGEIRKGLWTKARGLSDGDSNKCESIYIRLRAESIVDEAKVTHEVNELRNATNNQVKMDNTLHADTKYSSSTKPHLDSSSSQNISDDMPSYLKPRNATKPRQSENKYEQLKPMKLSSELDK
ncbi:hypothetical protein AB4344_18725 [Vibrio breoganii]